MRLQEIANLVGGTIQGDADLKIACVCGIDEQRPQAITFAENLKAAAQAERQGFTALVVSSNVKTSLPCVVVDKPRVAYAKLLRAFYPQLRHQPGCHPTASIDASAQIDASAYIGPRAVIGPRTVISARAEIEAQVIIGADCFVGEDSRLLAQVSLDDKCRVGAQCLVGARTRLTEGTQVSDDVEIGARCLLEGCQIAPKCRLDNMAMMRRGSTLGPGAIMVSQSTVEADGHVGSFCILAAQAVVQSGHRVGDLAQVGGRVLVNEDIPAGEGQWSGNPPLPYHDDMRRLAQRNAVPKLYACLTRQP